MYIQRQIKFKTVLQSNMGDDIEFLFVELLFSAMKILVGVIYNPPPSTNKISKLHDVLSQLLAKYHHVLIAGDFNINLLSRSAETKRLRSLANSLSLEFLDLKPTCHSAISPVGSLIDLFLVSNKDYVSSFGQVPVGGISEHDLIFLSYRVHFPRVKLKPRDIKDFNNVNTDRLLLQAASLDWNSIYLQSSSDAKLSAFYNNMNVILDDIPTKRIFSGPSNVPWFNNNIKLAEIDRDRAYSLWHRTRDPIDRGVFCRFRNKVTLLKRYYKTKFYKSKFDNAYKNPRSFFSNLKDLFSSKNDSSLPNFSCDELNDYFSSSTVPPSIISSPLINSLNSSIPEFNFKCIDSDDLLKSLCHVKSNAKGSDGIPRKLIHVLLPVIFPFILHIFNFIITSSNYPSVWKKSIVIPIPKSKFPKHASDFRPIGILPYLSKCFEHALKSQIDPHICDQNLLDKFQSGFRPFYGTDPALLKVTNDLSLSLDQNKISILVLLDFSKAFDSVIHKLLLEKLRTLFRFSRLSCNLMNSYLSNRFQSVLFNNKMSSEKSIPIGVVQGSILSTGLFSVMINDLPRVLRHCLYMIFADDFQFYISGYLCDIQSMYDKINEDFTAISKWADSNGLKLNVNKTQVILFSKTPVNVPPFFLNGVEMSFANTVKNLGIVFDSNLSWEHHINTLCGKIYGTLNKLYQIRDYLSEPARVRVIKSLIFPHLLYGSCLFSNCKSKFFCKLRKAVNNCTRFVYKIPARERLGEKRNALLGMPLTSFLKFKSVSYMFKLIKFNKPDYLFDTLTFSHSNRNPRNIIIPRCNSKHYHNSFFFSGAVLWNSLPPDIKRSVTVDAFRRSARNYFTNH